MAMVAGKVLTRWLGRAWGENRLGPSPFPGRRSSRSRMSIFPAAAPRITPTLSRAIPASSRRPPTGLTFTPPSSRAILAAAMANWVGLARYWSFLSLGRYSSMQRSLTGAAIRVRYRAMSWPGNSMRVTPDVPSRRRCQYFSLVIPMGVTAPNPVTTTRWQDNDHPPFLVESIRLQVKPEPNLVSAR